ncbi:MAG: transcriptional regulator [Treponema sp.]|nr:transcriptional regulator [Treponema sp.]
MTELSTEDLENSLREICKLLAKNGSSDFIYDFFGCLFTPAEMNDFAKRWLLVKEIDKGTTQREIAKKFHISLCKITRGSRELKKEESAFRKLLDYASSIEK